MLRSSALTTVALALSGLAAHAQDAGLWQPQIRAIIGADSNSGYSALEGFLPVKQNLESVLFLDVRSKYDFDDGFGQDVGLGIRRIVNPDLMIGGYAYLNIQNDNSHQFVATTLGLEAITSKYDAHVNVYLPISKDRGSNGIDSTLSLVGNQLLEEISAIDRRTYAAWGIEGEVGVQAPIDLPENQSLRFDIGAYHFADPDGDDHSITGAKAGIEYTIGDVIGTATSLTFAGEVRNDNRDNTQFAGSIRLTVPFNVPGKSASADDAADLVSMVSPGLRKRLNERVRGDIGVRLENQDKVAGTTTRVAINAATNAAFGKFFFANGDNDSLGLGTIGDPTTLDNAVAGAGANGIVVALGGKGNITTAGVTLTDGQIVIGGGGSVQAKLANGSVGTYNFGGSNGTIQGTNAANPVISLANNNTLSGITITGGDDGIFGNNVTGTKLTDVTVDGAGGSGADFTGDSTNVSASNFTSRNNGLDGLHIEGDGTYNFTGTTLLQNNGDDGLDVTGHGTYTFATVNALDNTDRGITVQGTSSGGSFTTTGGTISGNGGTAVFIDPITAHVVLDSITQDGGTSGVVLYNLSGSFTVNGATTISNTASAGIVIADSPATIRFGDIDITNVHDDAIRFNGVNAAVVAGNIVISGLGIGTGIDFSYSQTNFTAQSLKLTGTNAANTIGIDLAGTTGGTITFTNGGSISGVDTGVRLGISGSLANSANANFTFGGGSIAGQAASLDARGLNQTLGTYAFGTTTFSGGQLFDQQHLFFVGANGSGDGSSISNLASITDADNNHDGQAIFVLVNDAANTPIDAAGGFTLDAGQTMASFGNGRTFSLGGVPVNVTGDNVQHDQVVSDANGAATLTNTGAGDAVTVASNTSLLDFNIAGVANGNGIHGTNVTGVTLAGMSVSGASLAGVRFDGTSGISASNIGSTGNTGAGLALANGNFTFTGTTTVANNGGTGLSIVGTGAYAFDTVNAQNNRIGVDVVSSPGTSTLSIADGTVSGNMINGLRAANIGLDVTLSSLSHTGTDPGSTGLSLGAVTGSFNVTGTTTISNVASGIVVGGSSATVGFGGKVTVNNATTQAIGLIGNSGAVTFGDVAIDNPSQNGINVIGANGTIAFGNIDITNLQTGKTGLSMSGTSTFTAATLDISGGGTSTGIDLSGTTGGSVIIGSGVISAGTGVQMGTNGAAGVSAKTAFSFGTAGGASITGTDASLDMRGLMAGSGSYAFDDTALIGPQLFDTANIVFVGDSNTGAGNGSSVNDLISAALADDLGAPSNTIFVLVNNGSVINTDADGFTLAAGQSLVSFANGATVDLGAPPANVTGTNVVSGATQADPFGNGGATLINSGGSAIDLANGNLVQNLSVSNAGSGSTIDGAGISSLTVNGVTVTSAVTAFDLTGASGAIGVTNLIVQSAQTGIKLNSSGATTSFTNTTIGGVAGTALAISAYSGTATFNNFDITGAATGINIGGGTAGTLIFDNLSSIAGTAGDAFVVSASTPNVTYNGTINKTGSGRAVTISGLTSGSVTFAGKITANVTGSGNAIDLGGNAGGTINFTGGLDLTTDGSFAFSAVNGGTLNVTGTNTIATGGGVTEKGIQLGGASGLVIGSSGVTFDSVKVDGSGATDVSGIVISNTSGGNVSFGAVDISRASTDAIRLTNVASGTYTFNGTTTVATAGGTVPGFAVQNSGATVSVDNLVTTGVNGDDVNLTGNTGTISIGGTITNSGTGNGVVVSGGSAAITVSANVSSSAGAPGTAVKIDGTTGGSVAFTGSVTSTGTGNLFDIGSTTAPTGGAISFSGSTLSATGGGGAVIGGLGGTATFHAMTALSITNAAGSGLSVSNVASGAIAGFGNVTVSGAGGNGIEIGSNAGLVTFSGTTTVAMGSATNTAGIDFSGTNANVLLGTTTISNVGANQTGIDFSGSSTAAGFGVTSITGTGDLTSRGIDLSSTTGNKVITFLQGSSIADVGIGVDLSSGQTTATSADATFTFGDGDSTDGLESSISVATNGYTVNTVGLDPTLGDYDFDDVFFTGNANLGSAAGAVTLVSQSGGFINAGTTGNLSMGVSTISLAAADALTGTQNFAFVGPIDLGASAFTLDSGQTITGFGNGNVVSIGTIQPVNVHGSLGATGGNITGDETVVTGTGDFMHLLGDNAVRHTTFDFSGASGSAFLIDQSASGFSNASGIIIEGVTISNVAAGQTAIKVAGLTGNLSVINNDIGVAGTLLDVNGGSGAIQVSRGILPNSATSGTLVGGGINIANRTGGAVTFTDQVTIAGGNGVSISGGTAGGAVNFNGGLDIATSADTGLDFSGLNLLTVAAAGSTTINATGQTALSLQGAIGAGGVHFDSITSTNAAGQGVLISGASGGSVDLDAVNVTASGGAGIEVLNSNGTYTFGNTTIDNSASAGRGVNIENAASTTTVTFDGALGITTSTGTGLRVSSSAAPAATIVNVTGAGTRSVSTSNGTAVDIASATLNGGFTSVSASFSGTANGINLQQVAGSLDLGTGTLTNTGSGAAFNIGSVTDQSGGSATVSYAGAIASNGSGAAVSIQELTGGSVTLSGNLTDGFAAGGGHIAIFGINNGTAATVTFSGASKQIRSGTNTAVSLAGLSNGTVNFTNGGLAITTTSGNGFRAFTGGTVNVAGSGNTITTTSAGRGIDLSNVTVGSLGLNFSTVSANGPVAGISLASVGSSGGGAIAIGTANLQNVTTRGVDVTGTLGAALSFNDLDISLSNNNAVGFSLNGATINAAITANDFDVTNATGAGTSIGVDLRGATGGQTVRLGDANAAGNSSSITGVNTGVFLNSTTNLNFTYGDGESATDQSSTISANVGIDSSSAPVAGNYNFQDVNFQASPGLGFGIGRIYFVGASATGDGSGKDQSNLATLSTAEAAAVANDVIVLVNDGGTITAASTNADNTLNLAAGEQLRGFANGNIDLALTVPSTIQLASNNISIIDQTPNGAATLTTSAGNNTITLGASGNIIDGFILDGGGRGIKDNGAGASGTTISHMTIRNFTIAGIEITPSTSTTIDNVAFSGNATDVVLNALNSTITNVTSTGATGIAIDLRNTTGTTTLTNLNITTAATGTGIAFGGASGPGGTINGTNVDISGGSGITVTGGNAAIVFDNASSIAAGGSGTAASITNRAGGSFTFAGAVTANGAASGIVISGATAASNVSFNGTVDLGTGTPMTGTAVSINNNGQSSTINFANIDIASSGTTGFSVANGGTVNVATGTVSSTGAQAINLNGVATTTGINFTSTTSTGGSNNVSLTNVTGAGAVNLGAGTLSGASGTAFLVSGGSNTISYSGTIAKTSAGNVVSVSSHTGGTATFGGTISATVSSGGIALSNNTGATINFTNTLTINTSSSNATGFTATGGGTISATGLGSTINSGQATALNVANTTIGSGNLIFQSISSNGGSANGIILDTTGSSGGLHVTGTGSAGSGGTIANKTGADGSTAQGTGIYLNNTSGAQFAWMQMNDFQNYGILGNNVTGFSLDHVIINGSNGTNVSGVGEGDVYFTGLKGSATVSNSTFTGAALDAFHVFNNNGETLNRITITGSTFATDAAAGNQSGDALVFQATNGVFNATVQSSTFTSARGDLFQLDLHGGVQSDLVFGGATAGLGNTLSNNNQNIVSGGGGVTISSGGVGDAANLTFNIAHNTMRDAVGTALGISTGSGASSFNGTIDSNTIGVAGVANSGSAQGSDIGFVTDGGANSSVTITNNLLYQYNNDAIELQTGDAVDGGNHQLTAVVQGNTASNPGTFGNHGFELNAGTVAGDAQTVSLTLGGAGGLANNFTGTSATGGTDIRVRARFDTRVGLHGGASAYAGAPTDAAAIISYIQSVNNGTVSVTTGGTAGFYSTP